MGKHLVEEKKEEEEEGDETKVETNLNRVMSKNKDRKNHLINQRSDVIIVKNLSFCR